MNIQQDYSFNSVSFSLPLFSCHFIRHRNICSSHRPNLVNSIYLLTLHIMAVLFLTSLWVNLHVTDFSFFLPTYWGPLRRLCRSQGLPLDKVNNLPIPSSTHSSPFDYRDSQIRGGSIPDVVSVMLLKWEMLDTCCLIVSPTWITTALPLMVSDDRLT